MTTTAEDIPLVPDAAPARAAVAALRELMCSHDPAVGESPFWRTAFWFRAK
ncbi:hypothetical protein [Streptomyces sp. NPDC048637]|uniref:hypothetical protein n=1 Tax=Streptomyces sp. NPDC048637 TaxID=3155636 RepID=UPI0034298064